MDEVVRHVRLEPRRVHRARSMSAEERLRLGGNLSDAAREFAVAGGKKQWSPRR